MKFSASSSFAGKLHKADPLKKFRKQFHFPRKQGKKAIYFCGNSLGLQPKTVAAAIKQELKDWKNWPLGDTSALKIPGYITRTILSNRSQRSWVAGRKK